jgi:phospholipid transport system substrate-binding protein
MTWHARALVAVALLPLVLVGADLAGAGAPTDQLRAQIERAVKILDDPELKKDGRQRDRRTAVRQVANDIFDFSETAKRTLARHWTPRTQAERDEFVGLFTDLLERSYISKIELYGGEKVQFVGETVEGEGAVVRTKLVTKQGTEIPIDYRMLRRGEKWLVYDVVIEGVSLISNYRTQFNKIITTSSFQDLMKKMKTKQDEFIGEEKQQKKTSLPSSRA